MPYISYGGPTGLYKVSVWGFLKNEKLTSAAVEPTLYEILRFQRLLLRIGFICGLYKFNEHLLSVICDFNAYRFTYFLKLLKASSSISCADRSKPSRQGPSECSPLTYNPHINCPQSYMYRPIPAPIANAQSSSLDKQNSASLRRYSDWLSHSFVKRYPTLNSSEGRVFVTSNHWPIAHMSFHVRRHDCNVSNKWWCLLSISSSRLSGKRSIISCFSLTSTNISNIYILKGAIFARDTW